MSEPERPLDLDLDLVARLLSVADSSAYEGERNNAVRLAGRELRRVGMRFEDFVGSYRQTVVATEAAAILLRDLTSAQQRIAELEVERGTTPLPVLWNDVGDPCKQAQWCLDERAARRLYLNLFEVEFLTTVAGWYGTALTEKQQPVFEGIMAAVTKRSRRRPPS